MNYYGYGKSGRIFDSIEKLKTFHEIEIRSLDAIIIPLLIAENRVSFSTVPLHVPVEQGLLQGYKGLIVISLKSTYCLMN